MMAHLRELAGQPSPEEVASYLKVFVRTRENMMQSIMDKPEEVLGALSELKSALSKEKGKTPSRVRLCGEYLKLLLVSPYHEMSWKALFEDKQSSYRFYYDLYTGAGCLTGKLLEVEAEIAEGAERFVVDYIDETNQVLPYQSPGEQADEYLALIKDMRQWAEILKNDPSGFSVVDRFIGDLRKTPDKTLSSNHAREYVLAGAQFAGVLYKALWQIAGGLYPEDPRTASS